MKQRLMHSILILIPSILIGCGPIRIDDDLPNKTGQVCVNGLFTPDSVWSVTVTKSRNVLDADVFSPFQRIEDAQVEIWEEDVPNATLVYRSTFIPHIPPRYGSEKNPSILPKAGQ